MSTVEAITNAISELPAAQIEQIRNWLNELAEAEWDAQIEKDERAGLLDEMADRALVDHRAGRKNYL